MKGWPGLFLNFCVSSWCKGTAPEYPLLLWGPRNAAVGQVMGETRSKARGEKTGWGEEANEWEGANSSPGPWRPWVKGLPEGQKEQGLDLGRILE